MFLLLVAGVLSGWAGEKASFDRPMTYSGMSDASAGVAVSSNLFIVADDESNSLRLYNTGRGGPPIAEFDMSDFLEVYGKAIEADLEGGARLADRAFWIGSHGRNRNGKERDNRCRFFATDIHLANGRVTLTPAGRPYKHLLDDLIAEPQLSRFHLREASLLSPKDEDAFNIEGLSATPDGTLLIGFRNPIPEGKALLIPLLNPNEMIQGESVRFGEPIQLELGGLGIRDIAYFGGSYIISAGPYNGRGAFHFYSWKGRGHEPRRIRTPKLGNFHPEAVVIYPENGLNYFQILSDDGKHNLSGTPNRALPFEERTFRSLWVQVPAASE